MPTNNSDRIVAPLYGGTFTTNSAAPPIPYVLPGELVTSDPLTILEPSPHRVAPGCAHFGTCGGCHYQHADYPTQLSLKQQILETLLSDISCPPIQTLSADPWHYRNRIRLRIAADTTGTLSLGYSLRGTNAFLPITMCPIAAPLLWRAASSILELAQTDPLVHRWLAITSELELFCTPDEAKLQLQFFLDSGEAGKRESSSFAGLCLRLQSAVPELSGAGALLDPELNRRARKLWQGTAWAAEGLNYPAAGRTYWLPRGAFFQVNRFLLDPLVTLVTGNQSGPLAWDLYAGVGLFTRALAETFQHVVAVEGADAAVTSLRSAARSQTGIEPIHSATLDFLRARELQRERPSLVVLDPPRAGLGREGSAILARIAPARIVYVSCDPTSLARDLALFTPTYDLVSLHLVDLFPQTFHLETVVHLSRKGTGPA